MFTQTQRKNESENSDVMVRGNMDEQNEIAPGQKQDTKGTAEQPVSSAVAPRLDLLVDEHEEEVTVTVINKFLAVFDPGKLCSVDYNTEKPDQIKDALKHDLRRLKKLYEIDSEVIRRMFRQSKRFEPLPWEVGGKGVSDRK